MVAVSDQVVAVRRWLQQAVDADARGDLAAAEGAYLQALACDPDTGDAYFGLGVIFFKMARFDEAVNQLRIVIARGEADAIVRTLLGHALYMVGRFAESAEAFETAGVASPLEGESLRRHARARSYATMISGDVDRAIADYPALAGSEAEPVDTIVREGFGLFSAYGYREAAILLGERLVATKPDDPVQRHLNDAVAGRDVDSVPAAYVEAHFDAFADGFDDKLVSVLKYRVPGQLAALVHRQRASFVRMLDLGCGTGLAGEHLRASGEQLVGVDLSSQMLAHAMNRDVYTRLVHAEAVSHLEAHPAAYDLVFAADTLIYFGRLDRLLAAVAQATRPGSIFAASIESSTGADFEILPSGRFAHADSYLIALADPHFDLLERQPTEIRLEANVPARGTLFVWRRRQDSRGR